MRILHTMVRVGDLERSLTFYTEVLGMKVLRRKDYPEGRFTNCFVGYGDEAHDAVLELTHNWATKSYDLGTGYGHVAIEVNDAYRACDALSFVSSGARWALRRWSSCSGSSFPFCAHPQQQTGDSKRNTVIPAGAVESFAAGSVTAFQSGQFYLVRMDSGGFLALSCKCTHLGCTVPCG